MNARLKLNTTADGLYENRVIDMRCLQGYRQHTNADDVDEIEGQISSCNHGDTKKRLRSHHFLLPRVGLHTSEFTQQDAKDHTEDRGVPVQVHSEEARAQRLTLFQRRHQFCVRDAAVGSLRNMC